MRREHTSCINTVCLMSDRKTCVRTPVSPFVCRPISSSANRMILVLGSHSPNSEFSLLSSIPGRIMILNSGVSAALISEQPFMYHNCASVGPFTGLYSYVRAVLQLLIPELPNLGSPCRAGDHLSRRVYTGDQKIDGSRLLAGK